MMGKTHAALGAVMGAGVALAPSLLLGVDANVEKVLISTLAGAAGGILPDVDSKKSIANRTAKRYAAVLITGVMMITALLLKGQSVSSVEHVKAIVCALALAVFLLVGCNCSHRGFTHSLIACAVFTAILIPIVGVRFATAGGMGWMIHLAVDTLNTKGIQLAFPAKKRVCIGLCTSNGVVNQVMFYVGVFVVCILVAVSIIF